MKRWRKEWRVPPQPRVVAKDGLWMVEYTADYLILQNAEWSWYKDDDLLNNIYSFSPYSVLHHTYFSFPMTRNDERKQYQKPYFRTFMQRNLIVWLLSSAL
jgi:hypothetical protein